MAEASLAALSVCSAGACALAKTSVGSWLLGASQHPHMRCQTPSMMPCSRIAYDGFIRGQISGQLCRWFHGTRIKIGGTVGSESIICCPVFLRATSSDERCYGPHATATPCVKGFAVASWVGSIFRYIHTANGHVNCISDRQTREVLNCI